ncbi:MAG: porin family protein, partial [Hyphomicrobiales bacterium]|nr:porin family protein [Hyphomicrobiales bacterium]
GLFAFGGTAVQAAELPTLPEAPALPPEESLGNWYVRGDFGAASYSTSRWTQTVSGLTPGDQLLAAGFASKSIRDPVFVGAGFGYELRPWVRADVTAEYRASAGVRGAFQERVFNPSTPSALLAQAEFRGSLQSTVVMANAYADLGTWYGLTPYLGAGIGLARHDLGGLGGSGLAFTGTAFNGNNLPNGASMPVSFSSSTGRTRTNLAWAFMAGLSYNISSNLKLDLGYRHLDLGNIESGAITCDCGQRSTGFKIRNPASNEIRVGLRWVFGEVGPAALATSADQVPELPQAPILPKR